MRRHVPPGGQKRHVIVQRNEQEQYYMVGDGNGFGKVLGTIMERSFKNNGQYREDDPEEENFAMMRQRMNWRAIRRRLFVGGTLPDRRRRLFRWAPV